MADRTSNSSPSSGTDSGWLKEAAGRLGYIFRSEELLAEALTHRSFAQAAEAEPNYERLEFLGDALFELVVSDELLRRFPAAGEGDLTRMRASLVSRENLFRRSRDLGLGELLRLGKGEERSGGRKKKAILADAAESLAGAIYLDGGLEAAREFVLKLLDPDIQNLVNGEINWRDHKSRLQEKLHRQGLTPPVYRVVEETGPPHQKVFEVEVEIGGRTHGRAIGASKKTAEQRAAAGALEELAKPDTERASSQDEPGE